MTNNWISKDQPPKQDKLVWVFDPKAIFKIRRQRLLYFRVNEGFPKGVTHWREKPKEPNE